MRIALVAILLCLTAQVEARDIGAADFAREALGINKPVSPHSQIRSVRYRCCCSLRQGYWWGGANPPRYYRYREPRVVGAVPTGVYWHR